MTDHDTMPPKAKADRSQVRTELLTIRCTEEEMAELRAGAEAEDLGVSEWLREMGLKRARRRKMTPEERAQVKARIDAMEVDLAETTATLNEVMARAADLKDRLRAERERLSR